ncbi:hypothetical protein J6TS1_42520 [Siminovitchia terrae]|uniref:Uncharacterized protein n=1 Tax=Siminovitchia terrae TaxID=1914933 RepID=A0ABQ4L316_SIMTE|nr:hypothetical protein J6TS1_42520 [Siminovitchia terrae]
MKGENDLINLKMYIDGEWRDSSNQVVRDIIILQMEKSLPWLRKELWRMRK